MEQYLQYKLSLFHNYFSNKQYDQANLICEEVILDSKQALAARDNNSEEENNFRYIVAILFKGFSKFIELHHLTKSFNWHKDFKKVENIWCTMCDSVEYLNFSAGTIETEALTVVLKRLEKFSKTFSQMFGKGMYASPVIVISKETCSICKDDVRACVHRQGKLYNGVVCRHVAEEISEIRGFDIVQVPKDPRCRIWPWKKKQDGTYEVQLLSISSPDDFLYEK